jgi:SAM-dependent methyltransferase
MKGHVETPPEWAHRMARRLFRGAPPSPDDRILYPGSGTAPFAAAVEQVCAEEGWPLPTGIGVELDPKHVKEARSRGLTHVRFEERDFLGAGVDELGRFDYALGNPPYVSIEGLDEEEKVAHRAAFTTAAGRFDLYFLFFEQALLLLKPGGRLSFITPEKWTYVESAAALRKLLTAKDVRVEEIEHVDEDAFDGRITYPCVTTIRRAPRGATTVILRDGTTHETRLPRSGESWAAAIRGVDFDHMDTGVTLGDAAIRISAGVATGRDRLFVTSREDVPPELDPEWIYPTVSGQELKQSDSVRAGSVFICPYRPDGSLPDEDELGAYGEWAQAHRETLERRYCVQNGGKKWYAWHETPPMGDILRPKILFRDVADEPKFWTDQKGDVVPRHSVYYLVPRSGAPIQGLAAYLNSAEAKAWMEGHCQRAANGYMRLQSRVLRHLPMPKELAPSHQTSLAV